MVHELRTNPDNPAAVPESRPGVESNVAAFVLRPTLETISAELNEAEPAIRLTVTPAFEPRQLVRLYLNELDAPDDRPTRAYTLEAQPRETATLELIFPARLTTGSIASGDYLLHLRVDGAESPLDLDRNRVTIS